MESETLPFWEESLSLRTPSSLCFFSLFSIYLSSIKRWKAPGSLKKLMKLMNNPAVEVLSNPEYTFSLPDPRTPTGPHRSPKRLLKLVRNLYQAEGWSRCRYCGRFRICLEMGMSPEAVSAIVSRFNGHRTGIVDYETEGRWKRCERCNAPYCDTKCQADDWPRHRDECRGSES